MAVRPNTGKSRHPPSRPSLRRVPIEDRIAGKPDLNGDLLLNDQFNYGDSETSGQGYPLNGKQALAMALTEVCCDARRGKVFWCPIPSDGTDDRIHYKGDDPQVRISYETGLPKLVYIPFQWSEEDHELWFASNHIDRLTLLNARAGGIGHDECIMPIELVYEPEEKRDVRFNPYSDDHHGAKAALLALPRPYLAWLPQLRALATKKEHTPNPRHRAGDEWLILDREGLEPFAVRDWAGVVDGLEAMYFAGEERSLMSFRRLLMDLLDFAQGLHNQAFP